MKTLTKAMVGTVAAGAMAVSAASPAFARDGDRGISTGEVIAGALIIGGIAAVAASAGKNKRDRYGYRSGGDYRYDRAGYGRGGYDRAGYDYGRIAQRKAVKRCVRAAERTASRYSYGNADVTDIRSVRNRRGGYDVKGRIAVNGHRYGARRGHVRGVGWDGDYRGYNSSRHRGYDSGRFTCKIRHGRVVDIDFSGIRGLR